jgi:hypothetical protein
MPDHCFRFSPIALLLLASIGLAEDAKPRVAVFPLGGQATEKERERASFAIRAKLDRQGVYEPIDGPTMLELAGKKQIDFLSSIDEVLELSADEKPDLIIWGQYDNELKLNILDTRISKTKVQTFSQKIDHATDVRFAVEALVESLPGGKKHEHVTEVAVVNDETAEKLWRDNPNLFAEGTFDKPGDWRGILGPDKYAPKVVDRAPNPDEVVIRRSGDEQTLAMRLTVKTAESYGLACLSGKIPIEPDTRYRISFRYKSDGPIGRPFIKGYFVHEGAEREIYRRQVPKLAATQGEWVEVVDELNPQHTTFTVQFLRVDFYAYLKPGTVEYDDVVIKAVGKQTRQAKDAALDKPVERPKRD